MPRTFSSFFGNANLVPHYSATVGCNLLTVSMFCITSFPVVYRTMFIVPNTMLMNVMACRVFRNTKCGNQWTEPTTAIAPPRRRPIPNCTIAIPPLSFQESDTNSSATHSLRVGLILEPDSQSRRDKLDNADVIHIYSSHKNKFDNQEVHNRGGDAA